MVQPTMRMLLTFLALTWPVTVAVGLAVSHPSDTSLFGILAQTVGDAITSLTSQVSAALPELSCPYETEAAAHYACSKNGMNSTNCR